MAAAKMTDISLDHSSTEIVIEEKVYENQRHYLNRGWSDQLLPSDR